MFGIHIEFHGPACGDYREGDCLVSYIGDLKRSVVPQEIDDEASVQVSDDSFGSVAHHDGRADKGFLSFGVDDHTFKNVSGFFRCCGRFHGRNLAENNCCDCQNKFQFSHYDSFFLFPAAKV